MVSEEICGRFGSFRWTNSKHIALVELRFDNPVSASLFERFPVIFDNLKHNKQRLSRLNNGTMCIGSNVKVKLVTAFQLESLILAQNERWRQA